MDPQPATDIDRARLHGPVTADDIPPADVEAVRALARRYALAVDQRDEALLLSLFTDDAVVSGSLGAAPASEYLPKLLAGASAYAATQHNMTNQHVVRADDGSDDLLVHSDAVALHFGDDDSGTGDLAMGVEYHDRARRTERGWQISHRHAVPRWTRRGS